MIVGREWMEVRSVRVPQLLELTADFGPGEVEVLALALEEKGSLILVDNRLAREFARVRGLRITGTAGVLLRARQPGHIPAVRPLLDKRIELDFWLSDDVGNSILKLSGE